MEQQRKAYKHQIQLLQSAQSDALGAEERLLLGGSGYADSPSAASVLPTSNSVEALALAPPTVSSKGYTSRKADDLLLPPAAAMADADMSARGEVTRNEPPGPATIRGVATTDDQSYLVIEVGEERGEERRGGRKLVIGPAL